MTVLVISHTPHYKNANGNIVGWGPTVKELDMLADAFGNVIHIACLHDDKKIPDSAVGYKSSNVKFVAIKPFGGKGFLKKLSIITTAFTNIKIIRNELKQADVFQFRAPTTIGLYIIPYLSFFSKKKGWYKYAGNWVHPKPALSYSIQKWMLLHLQSRKITINGTWDNQSHKCISFENPCLTATDREKGLQITDSRQYDKAFRLCFVGRLDKEKGIYDLLDAIKDYPNRQLFTGIDIVGDGAEFENVKNYAKDLHIEVLLHGAVSREKVFDVYKQADFIVLPSESEGFPKVIAEAANFGCIPIVSNVSAIGQYVNEENGFLWNTGNENFTEYFKRIDFSDAIQLKRKAMAAHKMAALFTYDNYISNLKKHIIGD